MARKIRNQAKFRLLFFKEFSLPEISPSKIVRDWRGKLWGIVGREGTVLFKPDFSYSLLLEGLKDIPQDLTFDFKKDIFYLRFIDKIVGFTFSGDVIFNYEIWSKLFGIAKGKIVVVPSGSEERIEVYNFNGTQAWSFSKKLEKDDSLNVSSFFKNIFEIGEDSNVIMEISSPIQSLRAVGEKIILILKDGATHFFLSEGRQISVYMPPEKIGVFDAYLSPVVNFIYLIGEHGLDCVNVVEQRPMWKNPYFFENKILSFSVSRRADKIALYDKDGHFFLLNNQGEQLFQIQAEKGIIDIELSLSGDYVYFLYPDSIKLFKIISHGEEYSDEFSFLEMGIKKKEIDLKEVSFNYQNNSLELNEVSFSKINLDVLNVSELEREKVELDNSFSIEKGVSLDNIYQDTDTTLELCNALKQFDKKIKKENDLKKESDKNKKENFQSERKEFYPLGDISFFQADYHQNFSLFIQPKKAGIYNLTRKEVIFDLKFSSSNWAFFPLYGRKVYFYEKDSKTLKVYSVLGERIFSAKLLNFNWIFPDLKGDEVLILLDERKRLVKLDLEKGDKLWELLFEDEVVSIDADYILSRIIISFGNRVWILEGNLGKKIVDRSFSEFSKFVDVNGSGNAFGIGFKNKFIHLDYQKKGLKEYKFENFFNYNSLISLDGKIGLFWEGKEIEIIQFFQEKREKISLQEKVKDVFLSLNGLSWLLETDKFLYWKKGKEELKTFSLDGITSFHLSFNGKNLYIADKSGVSVF